MNRSRTTLASLALLLALPLAFPLDAATKKPAPKTAAPKATITIDTHADTPTEYLESPFDLGVRNSRGHFDYARMKEGGLDAEFFVAYVPAKLANKGAAAFCLRIMETIHEMVERHPEHAAMALSTTDIRRIAGTGRRAMLIGIEGGHAIEDSLDILRAFYRLGARYMTLTHTNTNNWADSSGDAAKHQGLTRFGEDVVREMNRLGMLVDISHVSDETFFDTVAVSKAPVFASHSSARAIADHSRNMTDEMLRAIGRNKGVVMVNFFPNFISNEVVGAAKARTARLAPRVAEIKVKYPSEGPEYTAAIKALTDADPLPKIPFTVIVDHIDHIVKVAGIDHVGLGSDFDGISALPEGMEDVSKLPKIRAELLRRGYKEADVQKIMGENFMRVFADVERVAKSLQTNAVAPAKAE